MPSVVNLLATLLLLLPSSLSLQLPSRHTLSILTFPSNTPSLIANESILTHSILHTHPSGTLSIVLRGRDNSPPPSLPLLRSYVSEIYSTAWDIAFDQNTLLDIIIYPQNLPNVASETWLYHRPTLECVVSHDTILGWFSEGSGEDCEKYGSLNGSGKGGLEAHVDAINGDRRSRGLEDVAAVHVHPWPVGLTPRDGEEVVFLEDLYDEKHRLKHARTLLKEEEEDYEECILGGMRIRTDTLYESVAVGGTFDGMHYGHRKLLTLAVSSVEPRTGKLFVGVTSDEMLTHKTLASMIPPVSQRIRSVKTFLGELAPGLKNRVKVIKIDNEYGPTLTHPDFDALVLSHETLGTGLMLNKARQEKGWEPLKLLCTRRTEINGMSSTALRRLKQLRQGKKKDFNR